MPTISVSRQCELLGLNRSSYYYEKDPSIDLFTIELTKIIDEEYTIHPFIGTRRMVEHLREFGHNVNRKRIQNLYRIMGIEGLSPKRNLSKKAMENKVYPYLLRGMTIDHKDQVWSTDITYIRLKNGFAYLMAIIDWYSRYVLTWELSNHLDAEFCITGLEEALSTGQCEIFNTDQGAQFTSIGFTEKLIKKGIAISMDGRGRALDNIFIERLWRSVKYECIYLREFDNIADVRNALVEYFEYYNRKRPHQSLDYKTPISVYLG